jgi:hypothetical protein
MYNPTYEHTYVFGSSRKFQVRPIDGRICSDTLQKYTAISYGPPSGF